MSKQIGICRAHTNIALIKYWGKRDEVLFLPMNSSLSLTLAAFYTDTKVTFDPSQTIDSFFLNNKKQAPQETIKITAFIDLFRQNYSLKGAVKVESHNHVPTAAGLASSASAFAALAGAVNQAAHLNIEPTLLSTYARRGSGSATRSIFGGFVEWQKGTSSADSCAVPIDDADWDIGMIILAINTQKKELSSRAGMKLTVATSPFYPAWITSAEKDLAEMKQAIQQQDFQKLGEITEANGMKMHATMLGANPPFSYWEPDSIRAIKKVKSLRKNGFMCYITMDAGPNVKILCKHSEMKFLKKELEKEFASEQIILSDVGPAIRSLSEKEWLDL